MPSQLVNSGSSIIVTDASDYATIRDFSQTGLSPDSSGAFVTISFLVSDYLGKANDGDDNFSLLSRPARLTPASRRDQIMIIVDILTFTQRPARRKSILRYLNLSQYQLKKYLRFLIAKGFLAEEVGESRTYKITGKGIELVKLLEGESRSDGNGGWQPSSNLGREESFSAAHSPT